MDRLTGIDGCPRVRVVLTYDISDDTDRADVADAVMNYLGRVELSVFDGWITERAIHPLWEVVSETLHPGDEAFILQLCVACASEGQTLGAAAEPDSPGTSWVV